MKALLAIIAVALSCVSCSMVPTPVSSGRGGGMIAMLVGGKGVLNYNADGSMAYSYSNEKSFQHAMQAGTTVALGYIGYLREKVTELTTQLANANLTSLEKARISADLSKFTTTLNAAERAQGITAGAPLGPVTFSPLQ